MRPTCLRRRSGHQKRGSGRGFQGGSEPGTRRRGSGPFDDPEMQQSTECWLSDGGAAAAGEMDVL